MNIFKSIISNPDIVTLEFLENGGVDCFLDYFSSNINFLAMKSYGTMQQNPLSRRVFKENARETLIKGILSFIRKEHHKKENSDKHLENYLKTSLFTLEKTIKKQDKKQVHVLTCPACSFHFKRLKIKDRTFIKEDENQKNLLICEKCSSREKSMDTSLHLKPYKDLYKVFSVHSKFGYRCKSCTRYIPESINSQNGICCPYPDCDFFGDISSLEKMVHPFTFKTLEIQRKESYNNSDKLNSSEKKEEAIEFSFESQISFSQSIKNDIQKLEEVILSQISYSKKNSYPGTKLQKTLMFEAFYNMLQKNPEDMVSYLILKNNTKDNPIQAKIFQEYVALIQDTLPYTIDHEKNKHEVISLFDPKISLFDGISSYESIINEDYTIPNETKERYIGGNLFKDYGSCFIGYLRNVINMETGESIISSVKEYNFVKIRMKNHLKPGTKVKVIHYRIPSHYEMGALTYLQRARKKIVNCLDAKSTKKKI